MSAPFDLESFLAGLDAWAEARPVAAERRDYGPGPDQDAVLRLPAGPGPYPVAVVVHGGFWQARYTRRTTEAMAAGLAEAGWASWNVEYRRLGAGGGYPATLEDVAAACRALRTFGVPLDPDRTIAVGHSAGGQLALWLAAEGLVAAAASLGGVCDLRAAAAAGLGDGAVRDLLGGGPDERPERYAHADPAQRLPVAARLLLVHGRDDDRVPVEQSRSFAAAAAAAGVDCRLVELEATGHFEPIDPRSTAWGVVASGLEALVS